MNLQPHMYPVRTKQKPTAPTILSKRINVIPKCMQSPKMETTSTKRNSHHGKSQNESVADTGWMDGRREQKKTETTLIPLVQHWRFPVQSISRYTSKPAITMVFEMKSWSLQRREFVWRKFFSVIWKLRSIKFFTGVLQWLGWGSGSGQGKFWTFKRRVASWIT